MRNSIIISAVQFLALAQALLTCFSMRAPVLVLTALALTVTLIMTAGFALSAGRLRSAQRLWHAVAAASAGLLGSVLFHRTDYAIWTIENALVAWMLSAGLGLTVHRMSAGDLRQRWLAGATLWAHAGSFVWLGTAYAANERLAFYAGLIVWLVLCVMTKRTFQLPAWGIQVINTWILFLTVIPLFSFLIAPLEHLNRPPSVTERPYSYVNARKNPAKHSRWLRLNQEEGNRFFGEIFEPGSARLRPGATAVFFDSTVSINKKGFRGKDLPEAKGNAYRIVALGESTTFGITMEAHDQPWPERLQKLIEERIKPSRPVQVINAGIPGWSLHDNLPRLPGEILALEPDMILSYHGYNGFQYVYDGMPPIRGRFAPSYRPRPVKILADVEYAWVMRQYRKDYQLRLDPRRAYVNSPLETQYADLYRELIAFAQTNRLRLALASYSMAVNEESSEDLKDFYRLSYQGVEWQIKANAAHALIVEELARQHPDICFIDTRPVFDGRHEMYTDLVHFAPEGKQQMAELFFDGIREILERDLSRNASVEYEAERQLQLRRSSESEK